MNALANQIKDIHQEIEIGRTNHEHKIAIEAYISMLQDCKPIVDTLALSINHRAVLKSELTIDISHTLEVKEKDKQANAIACWRELSSTWTEEDYRIKQSEVFSKFFNAVKNYAKILNDNNRLAFMSWVTEKDAEIAVPEAILNSQRKVPHLKQLAESYDTNYEYFKQLTNTLPTVDTAHKILGCLESIQGTKGNMVFDLPEPVKKFFQALDTGGAPLDFLTKEVRSWLDEHGQTENYVIRRKGQPRW